MIYAATIRAEIFMSMKFFSFWMVIIKPALV